MSFTPQSTSIPTIDNCDLSNPEEVFLWAFTCPPGLEGSGAAVLLPPEYYRQMSRRLVELGAVLDVSRVSRTYNAPRSGALLWEGGSGSWSDVDESKLNNGSLVIQSNPDAGGEYLD